MTETPTAERCSHADLDGRAGRLRTRWAAIGAAVAVTLGAGTLATVEAVNSSGTRAAFTAISPCRLMDTRPSTQVGPRGTAIGADETVTVAARGAQGNCAAADLPDDAVALQLNVTSANATARTFLAITPDGSTDSSSLNPVPGQPPTPNAVTVQLDSNGAFKIYNRFGSVDVLADVTGYYTDVDAAPDAIEFAAVDFGGFGISGDGTVPIGDICVSTPLPSGTAGRTVSEVTVFYNTSNPTDILVTVLGTDLAETPDIGTATRRHFVDTAQLPPTDDDAIGSFTMTHDATFPPAGPATSFDAGHTTLVVCPDAVINLLGVRVEF